MRFIVLRDIIGAFITKQRVEVCPRTSRRIRTLAFKPVGRLEIVTEVGALLHHRWFRTLVIALPRPVRVVVTAHAATVQHLKTVTAVGMTADRQGDVVNRLAAVPATEGHVVLPKTFRRN